MKWILGGAPYVLGIGLTLYVLVSIMTMFQAMSEDSFVSGVIAVLSVVFVILSLSIGLQIILHHLDVDG